jgi:hypothetical protein
MPPVSEPAGDSESGRFERSMRKVKELMVRGGMVMTSLRGMIHGTSETRMPVSVPSPLLMKLTVPYQDEAGVIGNLSPFVEVEGEGVGAFDALESRRKIGGKHCQCAIGAVDVEPEVFALAEISKRGEVVDGARVDCACATHYQEGREAGATIVVDRLLEGSDVNAVTAIGRDRAQDVAAEPGDIQCFGNATVIGSRARCG